MSNYIRNIKINYLFLVKDINLTQGIWMLYLASKGLSLFAIGTLEAVFHIMSFLMETPTGAAADLFGRKTSRILGRFLAVISSLIIVTSNAYFGFAIGFALAALSYNFESGAGEALIYDSLKAEGQEERFMSVIGRCEMGYHIASILGLLLGGILGNIAYQLVYFVTIFFSMSALIIGFFFIEPPAGAHGPKRQRASILQSIRCQYADCFTLAKSTPRLLYLIFFVDMVLAGYTMAFYYIQLNLERIGYTPFKIGIFLIVSSLAAIGGALAAEKTHLRLGEQKLINLSALAISLSIAACAITKFSILPMTVCSFVYAVLFVASRDYINRLIPSDKRATLLSFESMVFSFCMIAMFPLFGLLGDAVSIPVSFIVFGLCLSVLSLIGARW